MSIANKYGQGEQAVYHLRRVVLFHFWPIFKNRKGTKLVPFLFLLNSYLPASYIPSPEKNYRSSIKLRVHFNEKMSHFIGKPRKNSTLTLEIVLTQILNHV